MSRVKEAIDELIEEAYLLGLSEEDILEDFRRFIATCHTVIHQHIKDREILDELFESLDREKAPILMADRAEGTLEEGVIKGADEALAEKVARCKRQIIKVIAQCDPRLEDLIDAQRFQGPVSGERLRHSEPVRDVFDWGKWRILALKTGYAATVALIILLIYLSFNQSS
ncbi:MAG: hypothetical protein GKR89_07290 [Candidatus Latescibacteria bacterium]|nr:hypothetical protein [Candidatus Latescibacterota bacterium]